MRDGSKPPFNEPNECRKCGRRHATGEKIRGSQGMFDSLATIVFECDGYDFREVGRG